MSSVEKDAIAFHATFGVIALVTLLTTSPRLEPNLSLGIRIWALVIGYHMALIRFALHKLHREWLVILKLVVPISIFMVLPDGYLVSGLHTLVFPNMFVGKIYGVSSFMMLMWTIPLFASTLVGRAMEARGSGIYKATLAAGLSGFLLFSGSEEILVRIPIWYAQNCSTIPLPGSNVAVYILLPEFVLGCVTFLACRYCLHQSEREGAEVPFLLQILGAFMIMSMYLGMAVVLYMAIDADKLQVEQN